MRSDLMLEAPHYPAIKMVAINIAARYSVFEWFADYLKLENLKLRLNFNNSLFEFAPLINRSGSVGVVLMPGVRSSSC